MWVHVSYDEMMSLVRDWVACMGLAPAKGRSVMIWTRVRCREHRVIFRGSEDAIGSVNHPNIYIYTRLRAIPSGLIGGTSFPPALGMPFVPLVALSSISRRLSEQMNGWTNR